MLRDATQVKRQALLQANLEPEPNLELTKNLLKDEQAVLSTAQHAATTFEKKVRDIPALRMSANILTSNLTTGGKTVKDVGWTYQENEGGIATNMASADLHLTHHLKVYLGEANTLLLHANEELMKQLQGLPLTSNLHTTTLNRQ